MSLWWNVEAFNKLILKLQKNNFVITHRIKNALKYIRGILLITNRCRIFHVSDIFLEKPLIKMHSTANLSAVLCLYESFCLTENVRHRLSVSGKRATRRIFEENKRTMIRQWIAFLIWTIHVFKTCRTYGESWDLIVNSEWNISL